MDRVFAVVLSILFCFADVGLATAGGLLENKRSQEIHSFSSELHPLLFEIIENGVKTGTFVSVTFFATNISHTEDAECLVTTFFKVGDNDMALNMFSASAQQGTITNLAISAISISFEMALYGSKDRSLRFAATETSKGRFQARAVGVWAAPGSPTKLMKIEWKQVEKISLPSSVIVY